MRVTGQRSATGGRASAVVVTLVGALLASACTGGEPDEQAAEPMPVEVEGEVLDRRDDDEPDATDAGDVSEDAQDEASAGSDEAGTDGDGADAAGDGAATEDTAENAGDAGNGDGDDGVDAGTTGGTSTAPSGTPSAAAPTPAPRSPAPRSPAPDEGSEPAPATTPEPRRVADGPAVSTGPVLDSDGSEWTETSSTTVERGQEPPPLTVGLLPGEHGPQRPVRCQAALEAPADRGLVARGTLTVSLTIEAADGTVTTLPRQRIELDVTLAPGRRLELAVSPPRTLDVAEVRQVTCVAELTS